MKKKSSIIISSIAACAIFASAFAFNGFAIGDSKAVSQQVESTNVERAVTSELADKVTQQLAKTQSSAKDTTNCPTTKTSQDVQKKSQNNAADKNVTPVNTANTTSTKNNQQTNIEIKNKLQSALKNANVNADIRNDLQSVINNIDCNGNTAKNTNYSAIKAKLDSLLKSMGGSTATNPAPSKPTSSKPTTPSKPTTSAPAPTNGDYSAFQKKVVELVNAERAKNGLKPLTMNAELSKVATLKSQDMAKNNYFDHNSPTYGSPFDMMKKFGISYRTAGENIAMGQTSPEQVMQGWMNSPGHRANILKSSFTQIGVGIAKNSSGRLYWTQQFIG